MSAPWSSRSKYYVGQEVAFKRDVEKRCREFFSHCSVEEFDRALAETIAAQGGGAGASDAKCGLEAHCVKHDRVRAG